MPEADRICSEKVYLLFICAECLSAFSCTQFSIEHCQRTKHILDLRVDFKVTLIGLLYKSHLNPKYYLSLSACHDFQMLQNCRTSSSFCILCYHSRPLGISFCHRQSKGPSSVYILCSSIF